MTWLFGPPFQRPDSGQTHCNVYTSTCEYPRKLFQRPDSGQTHCNLIGTPDRADGYVFQRPDSGQTHCNKGVFTTGRKFWLRFNGLIAAKPTATLCGATLRISAFRCFNGLIAAKPTATSYQGFRIEQVEWSFNGLIAAKPTATVIRTICIVC